MKRAKKQHNDKKKEINPDFSDIHSEGACGLVLVWFLFVWFVFLSFSDCFCLSFKSVYKKRGFLQTRQLHWGQHSSFFLQSQLSITDITESISDITE